MTAPRFYTTPEVDVKTEPPLVHAVTVDRAVTVFLQRWLPTYLGEIERRDGRPTRFLARPTVYTSTYEEDDEDFYSDARMPTVIVTAQEASDWQQDGQRRWAVMYRTAISTICRGRSMPEARLQASLYCAAVTQLLIDRPSLDGFAGGVEPLSERPRPIIDPTNRSRNLAAGMGTYDIWVPNARRGLSSSYALTLGSPPADPDALWPPAPPVDETDVDWTGDTPPTGP